MLTPVHTRARRARPQQGATIIEVLVALAIFAIGMLGIAGLYATAVRQASGAEYRTTAAMLANDLIGRMWMSDRTAGTLQGNYGSSGNGAGYASWRAAVTNSGLPGADSSTLAPTVTFSTVSGGGTSPVSTSLATITIFWKGPGDATAHQYVALAQMKP
ncbi:type IV pilus assembly protein PilV [Pseudacidovorax intermedius]|uniref:Type IV pilus assembly protein PilV n=1 Tax=Pseudacidovorax intermedius TaxID=433924 RepID=A0A370FGE2_9BURK|nr:type IV pilus modification protein PilV [Pseudacidovorax intermedius]RDI25290.1 type IV pilus assembly protein PilV [Pseudacidovorax intermedius]